MRTYIKSRLCIYVFISLFLVLLFLQKTHLSSLTEIAGFSATFHIAYKISQRGKFSDMDYKCLIFILSLWKKIMDGCNLSSKPHLGKGKCIYSFKLLKPNLIITFGPLSNDFTLWRGGEGLKFVSSIKMHFYFCLDKIQRNDITSSYNLVEWIVYNCVCEDSRLSLWTKSTSAMAVLIQHKNKKV